MFRFCRCLVLIGLQSFVFLFFEITLVRFVNLSNHQLNKLNIEFLPMARHYFKTNHVQLALVDL